MQWPGQHLTNHPVGRLGILGNPLAGQGAGRENAGRSWRMGFFKGGFFIVRAFAKIRVKTRYSHDLKATGFTISAPAKPGFLPQVPHVKLISI